MSGEKWPGVRLKPDTKEILEAWAEQADQPIWWVVEQLTHYLLWDVGPDDAVPAMIQAWAWSKGLAPEEEEPDETGSNGD